MKTGWLFALFTTFTSLNFGLKRLGLGGASTIFTFAKENEGVNGTFATFSFSNMRNGYRGNTTDVQAQARKDCETNTPALAGAKRHSLHAARYFTLTASVTVLEPLLYAALPAAVTFTFAL